MDNQTSPYSAFFKLYGKENLQISFNVTSNGEGEFLPTLNKLLESLYAMGYKTDPAGLEEGETIREVDSWVLGKTSNGDLCIYLYKFPLKWRVATIYNENIAKMPFKVPAGTAPLLAGAPEREIAEKNKILHSCPTFKIVMTPTGAVSKTTGKPTLKFNRMWGDTVAIVGTKETTTESDEDQSKEDLASQIQFHHEAIQFLEEGSGIQKFVLKARELQNRKGTKVAAYPDLETLLNKLDEMIEMTGYADVALSILSGVDTPDIPDKISGSLVKALMDNFNTKATNDAMRYLMSLAVRICE